ncbi:Transferase [Parasponia andersonii]|uniref:Transferase n=1 Tax=Parasponia andersonii TaxID=3476 RepID=A0A2P5DNT3_PARAD|nr:Transferase [Parasponia andersonii]
MAKIKVKEMTMIKPAAKTHRRTVWLSGLDLMNSDVHSPFVYFYKPNGASDFFNPAVLKEALSKVLVSFYPMAGRFSLDSSGRLEIECNDEGALFVVAESSSVIGDFGDFTPTPDMRKLVPAVDYSGGISSYPFLVLQVTYFKCGGVSLGVGVEHRVVDGPAAFHFVNEWSNIARGLKLAIPPVFDRTIFCSRNPPQVVFNHFEYQLTPGTKTSQQSSITSTNSQSGVTSPTVSVFEITIEQLNVLKAKAKDDSNIVNYSTYEILAGYFWKCASIARAIPNSQETRLHFAANGRNLRLKPRPQPGYFGTAVFVATSAVVASDLQSKPLWYAASRIRETLVRMDDDYLRSAIDYLEFFPDTKRDGAHFYESPNFRVTSWMKMPLYEANFGWGRPFYVGPAAVMYEGKAFFIPTANKDGSLLLILALQHEQMEVFKKLFYEYYYNDVKQVRYSLRAKL